jgi:polysaccharide deacetylase
MILKRWIDGGHDLGNHTYSHPDLNFGRETSHVMLLHANRLNADALDDILRVLEERQFRFVRLSEAQSDPAYQTPDALTKFGPMWAYRWARSLGVNVNARVEPEPADWISRYADNKPAK